jgi:hexulose-6-phosphate isomerase
MTGIGIMQGRLSAAPAGRAQQFPRDWAAEFAAAAATGFTAIEWLLTAESLVDNPLLSSAGVAAIRECGSRHRIPVLSVCADCFIAVPLTSGEHSDGRRALLARLVYATRQAGAAVLVVPFLEGNTLRSRSEARRVLTHLSPALDAAADAEVAIAIESDWPAGDWLEVVADCGHPSLRVCYDTGNAFAAGGDPPADLRILGARVSEVHIKDRRRGGDSVPLGQGDVDFDAVFAALLDIGFNGPVILETPVGDDPVASAIANRAFVESRMARLVR